MKTWIDPNPENVADLLALAARKVGPYFHGNDWELVATYNDGAVCLDITPCEMDTGETLPVRHFRAVVVEGEGPVVVASPAFLAAARALYRVHVIGPALASEEFTRLVFELGTALEALTPEQVAVLAGDDDQDGGDR